MNVIDVTAIDGRAGEVLRTLPHGTVIIWDPARERSYPYYKAGPEKFRAGEAVRFVTDKSDTVVVSLHRVGGRGRRSTKKTTEKSLTRWFGRD